MRHRLGQLWHIGLDVYSSDLAFSIAANIALAVVFIVLVTWLVTTVLPSQPSNGLSLSTPPPHCSRLAGQCW
jgi:hypothetical protein